MDELCHNVVLLGLPGSGKSTLGNFLIGSSEPFLTSGEMSDCTISVQREIVPKTGIHIVDTPSSLNHNDRTLEMMTAIHQLRKVSLVIICIRFGARNDNPTKSALTFFLKFLEPLFARGNVVLALTKTDNEVFLNENIENIAKDASKGFLGGQFRCELINCVRPKRDVGSKNIWSHSEMVRERILQDITTSVDIYEHKFPLPPLLEERRHCILTCCKLKIDAIIDVVSKVNGNRGFLLEQITAKIRCFSGVYDKDKFWNDIIDRYKERDSVMAEDKKLRIHFEKISILCCISKLLEGNTFSLNGYPVSDMQNVIKVINDTDEN